MNIDSPPDERTIRDTLVRTVPDLVAVYLFGSTVYGVPNVESDIDVAVLTRGGVPLDAWFAAGEDLSTRLRKEVDVLDLTLASPVLSLQVITRGRLIVDVDPAARIVFEGRALGEYARLNDRRWGILERVGSEGTVYGR